MNINEYLCGYGTGKTGFCDETNMDEYGDWRKNHSGLSSGNGYGRGFNDGNERSATRFYGCGYGCYEGNPDYTGGAWVTL